MNSFRRQRSDYWLSLIVFGLIVFGLIMIYSVSKYYSLEITNNATDKFFLKKQLTAVGIGLIVWIVMQAIDYRVWQKYAGVMLFITIGLLISPVILSPLHITSAGRWIVIGGMNLQPAELAKLSFIFYLAGWFAKEGNKLQNIARLFWPFVIILGSVAALMLFQKDLGTLAIFAVISASIFIAAGAPIMQIVATGGLGGFILWLAVKIEPYRMKRVMTFLNPKCAGEACYHIKNAMIAIGSGGLFGLGFGQSRQKYLYLPAAHTDSIFAIICEELGVLRSSLVLLAFGLFALRGLKIARQAPDNFARLVAVGITIWVFIQAVINVAATFSLVPLTGVPLPFISYGGSSIIILLAAVGVLTNISKNRIYEK